MSGQNCSCSSRPYSTRARPESELFFGTRADAIKDRVVVLSVAELIGDAIHRIHHNESVSALFKNEPGRAMSE